MRTFMIYLLAFLLPFQAMGSQKVNTLLFSPSTQPGVDIEGAAYYDSTEKKLKLYNGSAWSSVGSGAGGGGNTLNLYEDTEADLSTEWTAYDDVSAFVDGTGGSPNITCGLETAETLGLSASSYELVKDAADRSNEGCSFNSVTLPRSVSTGPKRVQLTLDMETAGTYASDDAALYVYLDSTGIVPCNMAFGDTVTNLIPATGSGGRTWSCAFDAGASDTVARVSVHIESSSSSAYQIRVDNIALDTGDTLLAYNSSPWETVNSPTSNVTTNATFSMRKKRDGSDLLLELDWVFSGSNTQSVNVNFTLPDGLVIDTERLAGTANSPFISSGTFLDSGGSPYSLRAGYLNTTQINVLVLIASGTYTIMDSANPSTSTPAGFTSGDRMVMQVRVPIEGWHDSNVMPGYRIAQETLKVDAATSSASHTNSGNWQTVTWTEAQDDFGAFASNTFTAPFSGDFYFQGAVVFTADATGQRGVRLNINSGTDFEFGSIVPNAGASLFTSVPYAFLLTLGKDDTVSIEAIQSSGGTLNYENFSSLQISGRPNFTHYGNAGIHERKKSSVAYGAYSIAADEWGDFASVEVGPGTWDFSASATCAAAGGAITTSNFYFGVSSTSGNSSTGLTLGDNQHVQKPAGTASGDFFYVGLPTWEQTVTSATTFYFKTFAETSTTNLNCAGTLTAERHQ